MRLLTALMLSLAASALAGGALATSAAAQTENARPSASSGLAQVESHLRQVKSLQADFIQTADTGAVARGEMILAKPGKVRFDFGKESPFLIVSNGSVLSMVDYDVAQVNRRPAKEAAVALALGDRVSLQGRARLRPTRESSEGYVAIERGDP